MQLYKVAVVYAGRWFGRAGKHFVDNHLQHLIRPTLSIADVTVVVLASHDQWCSASDSADEGVLLTEVRDMFGCHETRQLSCHAALVPAAPALDPRGSGLVKAAQTAAMVGGGKGGHASAFKIAQLMMYMRQFGNVASADALRARFGPHDVIIKARIDILYAAPVSLTPLCQELSRNASLVFAPKGYTMEYSADFAAPQWRDWNLVMTETCAAALDDASSLRNASEPLYDPSRYSTPHRKYQYTGGNHCRRVSRPHGCPQAVLRLLHRRAAEAAARTARLLLQRAPLELDTAPHPPPRISRRDGRDAGSTTCHRCRADCRWEEVA